MNSSKNLTTKKIIVVSIIILIVSTTLLITASKEESKRLLNKEVSEQKNKNTVAVYIQDESSSDGYVKTDAVPTEGYTFNEEMSYCTIDGNRDDSISISYNADTQSLSVSPMTRAGTKCYLYFDELVSIRDTLLAYYPTQLTRTDFSTTLTNTTTGTIYKSADESQYDEDGEVYYFAGNPTDNWVYFAGYYWRIIRINGDGSLRLIYQGISTSSTGQETHIIVDNNVLFMFNSSVGNNAYVGYMYTSGSVHGTGTSSTIKGVLDNWYLTNIQNAGYSSYIDTNAGFCGDRSPSTSSSSSNGNGGTGTTETYYGGYIRLYNNGIPTFRCANDSDLFTTDSSSKGNKALTYSIGLITMDEAWYAGGHNATNSRYYLYTQSNYWTMSPFWSGDGAGVFYITRNGSFEGGYVDGVLGVRPVINLRSDVTISSGNGTASQPFVINTD